LGSSRKVLGCLAGCCALTSAAALLSVFLKNDLVALVTCSVIVIIFTATGMFGRPEFLLLAGHLRRASRSLVRPMASGETRVFETVVRLQGSRQWELLWAALTESADKLQLSKICLDVDLTAAREGYHASWERPLDDGFERCWRMEIPLVVADRLVGRLTMTGQRNGESACRDIERLLDLVEPFETHLLTIAQHELPSPTAEHHLALAQRRPNESSSTPAGRLPR
jgi:hypothetical protein